jgi:BirA family biotin operon repressor/biotin-[acetyl-CoA-carboxylase] ligase
MFEPLPFDLPLTTQRLGRALFFAREVDSTNRVLAGMVDERTPEGTLVLADFQEAGRGRRARAWAAPPGSSLLLSVLLRPSPLSGRYGLLPIVVGVAVARALESHLGLRPAIKWPNDLLLDGRKCCGILIESATSEGGGTTTIVGIGLNVNQEEAAFTELPDATSLRLALGREIERGPLLAALLTELERAYDAFLDGWEPHDAWRRRSPFLGQPIMVHPADGEAWPATALDLAPDGSLIVQDADGQEERLQAADVSVRRMKK